MIRKVASTSLSAAAIALLCAAVNAQEFPILDKVADKVIQKYQQSTCEQLWQQKAEKGKTPESPMEQRALEMLKSDSADARGIHQQGRCSHRQQNVRMRNDSVMIRNKFLCGSLSLASAALLVTPNAQSNPKAAKKKTKVTAAEASPAPEATPSLEPKAIEILKAASSRLAAAQTMKFNAVHFYESPSRHGLPTRFHHKVRGYSPETGQVARDYAR